MWAIVNSDGTIRSQSGGVTTVGPTPGSCTNSINSSICVLNFGRNITSCAVVVSPETNTSPATSAPLVSAFAGQHPYNGSNQDVVVQTYAGTTPTAEAFDIAVFC
jgi:hypothetical protein